MYPLYVMLDIIGVRCSKTPAELIAHFDSLGIEAVLFNPNYVCGKEIGRAHV